MTIQQLADDYIGHPEEIDEDSVITAQREAFKAGALWQRNSVWHDASETPTGADDKEIFVIFIDYHTSVWKVSDWDYLDHQTKWCYLSDILPTNKN